MSDRQNQPLSIRKLGGGGVNPEHKFVNADQTISTIAFDAIVSTETVINSVIHKRTLPSSPKVLGDFDSRVLLEVNGLLPSFDAEIKRQISDNLNIFFATGYASYCSTTRDFLILTRITPISLLALMQNLQPSNNRWRRGHMIDNKIQSNLCNNKTK